MAIQGAKCERPGWGDRWKGKPAALEDAVDIDGAERTRFRRHEILEVLLLDVQSQVKEDGGRQVSGETGLSAT